MERILEFHSKTKCISFTKDKLIDWRAQILAPRITNGFISPTFPTPLLDLLPAKNGEEPTMQFLLEVVDILTNYVKKTFDRSTKVLDFHHPHQLLEGIEGFNLELSDQPESLEQILVDCRDTLKYGVRTGKGFGTTFIVEETLTYLNRERFVLFFCFFLYMCLGNSHGGVCYFWWQRRLVCVMWAKMQLTFNFLHWKQTAVRDVVLHLITATHILVIKQDITSLLISTHVQCVDFECDTNY